MEKLVYVIDLNSLDKNMDLDLTISDENFKELAFLTCGAHSLEDFQYMFNNNQICGDKIYIRFI